MAYLVGSGTPEIKRRGERKGSTEVTVINDNTVSTGATTGELGVAQNASADFTHPHIHGALGRNDQGAVTGLSNRIIGSEAPLFSIGNANDVDEAKFNLGICRNAGENTRGVIAVSVGTTKIVFEDVDLTVYLRVGMFSAEEV